MEVFSPKYETSSDIVTNKKGSIEPKKERVPNNYIFYIQVPLPKKLRERERERERERAAKPVEKFLMSLFFIYIFHLVIIVILAPQIPNSQELQVDSALAPPLPIVRCPGPRDLGNTPTPRQYRAPFSNKFLNPRLTPPPPPL